MINKILAQYRRAFADLPREVWLLAVVMLINRIGMLVMPFISLYLVNNLKIDVVHSGLVFSAVGVGSLFGSIGGGWASEKWGVTRVQTLSLIWNGFIYLLMEHLSTLPHILIAAFLIGLIGEAFRPANNAAVALFTPEPVRARAYGLNRLAMNLGMGLGPAYGGFLAEDHFEWIFRIDAVTCFFAALILAYTFRGKQDRSLEKKRDVPRVRWPFHDRLFMIALGVNLIYGFSLFLFFTIVPLFLDQYAGIGASGFGMLLLINGMLIILFEMLIAHRLESRNYLLWCAIGVFLNGAGYTALLLQPGWSTALVMVLLITIAEMVFIPLFSAFVANRSNDRERGRYMGLFSLSFAIAQISSGVGGGWLYAHFPLDVWWMLGLLGIFGALILWHQSKSHNGRTRLESESHIEPQSSTEIIEAKSQRIPN